MIVNIFILKIKIYYNIKDFKIFEQKLKAIDYNLKKISIKTNT